MHMLPRHEWAVAVCVGLLSLVMACSSGSTTPEMADVGNGTEDQRQGDGVADQAADVLSDISPDVISDVRPDTVPDLGPDAVLPDLMPDADAHDVDIVSMDVEIPDLQVDADATCVPVCGGAVCGDDGCGGSCGPCDLGTTCQQGQCVAVPCQMGVACDDLNPCTYEDTCMDDVCVGTAYVCDDQKECTKDECDGLGECIFTIKAGNCLINNVCYANETLKPDNACEECITAISKTTWSKDDTNLCTDGNACTLGDACSDGICLSGTGTLTCANPGPCKSVACQAALGCVTTNAMGSCEDGNPCTVGDACSDGVCLPGTQAKDCSDSNPCTLDGCAPLEDCTHENIPGVCNDGDGCTENDFCDAGVCKGGTLKASCNDGNPCTVDSCINGGQCQNLWNDLPCNDGNECTINDVCSKGQCGGTLRDCGDNNICTTDFCSPLMPGGCYYENNDLGCDDHDPCTLGDTCGGGQCQAGLGKLNCNDNNECTEDVCMPGSGCKHTNLVAFCNDGDACTSGDFCANGTCVGGTDICACHFNSDCAPFEDLDKCNGTLYCDTTPANPANWACKVDPLTVKTCSPLLDTPCRKNTCAPATGLCSYVNVNEGLGCDDGNGCTLNDACVAGVCAGGPCSLVGLYCVNGSCGAQLCTPNTSRCEGNVVKLCNATGSAEAPLATCNATQYCAQSGGSAFCAAQVCVPDTNSCLGSAVMQCDNVGATLTQIQDCGATGQWCSNGECANFFLCAGVPCPVMAGYATSCNSHYACEYTNMDTTGWKAKDVWIFVPASTFQMGSSDTEAGHQSDEAPLTTVTFPKGYFIMKYELTAAEYSACMSSSPTSCTAPSVADWNACGGGVNTPSNGRSDHPQNGLTWQQASNACAWLGTGARLATEAEWEYAAAGPSHVKYPWGSTPEPTCANDTVVFSVAGDVAGCGCGTANTWPVGSKSAGASWVGALDMAGNVWEWTLDTYHSSFTGSPTDGTAWLGGTSRVIRGGALTDNWASVRTAERRSLGTNNRNSSVGSRCVRPAPDTINYVIWPVCVPGTVLCNGNVRSECNPTGSAYVDLNDCTADGLVCKAGVCSVPMPTCTGPVRYANGARFTYFESTDVSWVLEQASAALLTDVEGKYWLGDTTPDPHSEAAPWTYIIDFGCAVSVSNIKAYFPYNYDAFKSWSIYYTTDTVLSPTTNWVLAKTVQNATFWECLNEGFPATPESTRALKIVVMSSSRGTIAAFNPDLGRIQID